MKKVSTTELLQEHLKLPADYTPAMLERALRAHIFTSKRAQTQSDALLRLAKDRKSACLEQAVLVDQLQRQVAALTQARINDALKGAIIHGRIPSQQESIWRERLVANFDKHYERLIALRPIFWGRCIAVIKGGLPRFTLSSRLDSIKAVQERCKRKGERMSLAWHRLMNKGSLFGIISMVPKTGYTY